MKPGEATGAGVTSAAMESPANLGCQDHGTTPRTAAGVEWSWSDNREGNQNISQMLALNMKSHLSILQPGGQLHGEKCFPPKPRDPTLIPETCMKSLIQWHTYAIPASPLGDGRQRCDSLWMLTNHLVCRRKCSKISKREPTSRGKARTYS